MFNQDQQLELKTDQYTMLVLKDDNLITLLKTKLTVVGLSHQIRIRQRPRINSRGNIHYISYPQTRFSFVNLAFFYFNRLGGHIMMRASHWEDESLMVRVRVTFDRLINRGWNKFSFSQSTWDLIFDLLLSFCGGANWKKKDQIT